MVKQKALQTQRLTLKAISTADLSALFRLHSDEQVLRFINRQPPENEEITRAFIEKISTGVQQERWYYWGLYQQAAPSTLIGTICLWQFNEKWTTAEIGFDLLPEQQGRGLMQEAVSAILLFSKEHLQLETIRGIVRAENQACIRLLQRNDFRFVRALADDEKFTGEAEYRILLYECLC